MKIKQDRQICNFGATSELSREILSRVAQKLNPTRVDGSVSGEAKKYLSTFSTWSTSQGVSDELKKYMLPLPEGHQSSYPDAFGLEKTTLENALFDDALQAVIKEMYEEQKEQTNFSEEDKKTPGDETTGLIGAAAIGLPSAALAYIMEDDEDEKAKNAVIAGGLGSLGGFYLGKNSESGAKYANKIRDIFKANSKK